MWYADVTSSQRSPCLGATSAFENSAFSTVFRECRSMISRDFGYAEALEDRAGVIGFPCIVRNQIPTAAGKHDAGVRIATRERRRRDDAIGRTAHHRRAMCGREIWVRSTRRGRRCHRARRARGPTAESADSSGIEQQVAERRKPANHQQQRPTQSRACGRARQIASPAGWRREARCRSGNSSATA